MKNFNKYLIVAVFVFALSFQVTFARSASSSTDVAAMQAQLQALQAQAQSLQAQAVANGIPVGIAGCNNGTVGFSTVDGKSCAGNIVGAKVYKFGSVTLKNGSKGEAVKELQRFLNAKLDLGLKIDGKLGPKTIIVIKKWQKDHGLVADGLIGAKTKLMMNSSVQ
jgi:murein L,D-transpeptidase YcbB/YkuD